MPRPFDCDRSKDVDVELRHVEQLYMRLSANLRFEFRGRLPGSNGSDDTVAGLQCGVR